MKVKLISTTTPQIEGLTTAEDLIVYCARVSNPNNQLNTDTGARLINYCIKHKHWSIFDQADMTVEIQTSRGISPQILRHSSLKFQEFSQRYATLMDVTYEPIEFRLQGNSNRQVGDTVIENVDLEAEVATHLYNSSKLYNKLIDAGVASECARFVLPLAVSTTLYAKGTVRSWIHYLQARLDSNCQKEHRIIAEAVLDIFKQEFPQVSKALGWLD